MNYRTMLIAGVAAVLALSSTSRADTVTFRHNYEFSDDGTAPTGVGPWVTATVEDKTGGGVRITMSTAGLSGSEYLDSFYFNLNPQLNLSSLSVPTWVSGVLVSPPDANPPGLEIGTNAFKADGDGYFDLIFRFPQSGSAKFGAGASSVYDMSGVTAADFRFTSAPSGQIAEGFPKDGLGSAAHVQSIGTDGKYSGWTTGADVPPPGEGDAPLPAIAPAGLALLGLVGLKRRRK